MTTIESTPRQGAWMQTYTGKQFFPLDANVSEIDINDIAHALSNLCRFGGHCSKFYSVAEHSVNVSKLLPDDLKLDGLLHDATEAYLVDVPRPIKGSLLNYKEIEHKLACVIEERFTGKGQRFLNFEHVSVKDADNVMLMTEADQLLGEHPAPWGEEWVKPLKDFKVECLSPAMAKCRFLDTFITLYHARNLYLK